MRRIALGIAAVALVAALAPRMPAQAVVAAPRGYVGGPVSLDLRDVPIADLLRFFHEQFGVNFVLDPSLSPVRVTVALDNVPWNFALDQILRAHGLGALREGPETWAVVRGASPQGTIIGGPAATGAKVSLEYTNADLRRVVRDIAERAGASIVVSDSVPSGLTVTISVKDVPWDRALGWVLWSHGLVAVQRGETTVVERAGR